MFFATVLHMNDAQIIKNPLVYKRLQELGVKLLLAFGSRVEGTAREQSDYDIGVVFDRSIPIQPRRYGVLYGIVQDMFPDEKIDLVGLNQAPYPLQFRAAMKGDILYQETPASCADFRERAMLCYFDFQPILKIHEDALGI